MTIDREPGGSTMIRVSLDIRDQLNALKNDRREAIGDVVKRIILDNRRLQHKENKEAPTKILAPDQPTPMPDLDLPAWRTIRSMPRVPEPAVDQKETDA